MGSYEPRPRRDANSGGYERGSDDSRQDVPQRVPLSVNMGETVTPGSLVSRASQDRRAMSALEQALGGPAIEVVAKATRQQFTVEYKRKIVRSSGRPTAARRRARLRPWSNCKN